MPVTPSSPEQAHAVIAIVTIIAVYFCAVYWRIALRLIVITVVGLIVYGAIVGYDGVSALMTSHHR